MPEANNSCLKCKGETEPGFVLDTVSATVHQPPSWIEGMPEPDSLLSGYAGRRMRTVNKVMRCKTCGYLEYYASGELLYA
jgi:predicted nucleic-acid-binding Zn-ribbon protein